MDTGRLIRPCALLLISICVCVVSGDPIGTSVIVCDDFVEKALGPVDEGYEGDVEVFTGIIPGTTVKLVPFAFDNHLEFLELVYTLGETTATVRTKKPLDADALIDSDSTLYYSVMCVGDFEAENMRTLRLNDLNDNSPVFTQDFYSTTVPEEEELDTEVYRVTATDGDSTEQNNRLTYSFVPATEDFDLTNAGAFILKRRLNYNVAPEYTFTVTARDREGLSDTATVLIKVKDFDNLNPFFNHNVYEASIAENEVGPFSTMKPEAIKAQDGDMGINMTLTYSISAVSPEKYRANFNIDSSSAVLSVEPALDREEMGDDEISVTIQATQTDDSSKKAEAVVSVTVEDVNDNSPEFDEPNYSLTLLENSPDDTVVFKAIVTDKDQGGFVGTLRIIPETTPFSISSDGTVTVKDSTLLDRETIENFIFQIEAEEANLPRHFATANVNVTLLDQNDNSPVFRKNTYEGKVFGNQTVGLSLVQVKAEDPDAGRNGQIKYSIDFGNNDGYFSIEADTGEITLAKLIPLEENKILEFLLTITARDEGEISRSNLAQVNIRAPGHSNPQFLHKVYHGTVAEEQDPGVMILKVDFLSLDEEVPVTFRVESETDKFSISSSGEFSTKMKLDYDEGPHNYSVQISISDGTIGDTAVVEVQVTDINDNSPIFDSSSVEKSVSEDAVVGFSVALIPATDKDSSFNKEIRYSLIGGEAKFAIDTVSGMVSVAAPLDWETKAEYNMKVVAEDQGRPVMTATASLLVQVTDINDNAPKFSQAVYQVEVSETESVGADLLTLSAVDPDEGANGRVTYSIVQQSPPSDPPAFELVSSNGTLRLAKLLDWSEVKVYSLKVQASDGGTPSLVGSSSVVLRLRDVNNNPPEFSEERYNVSVSENLARDSPILTLEVTDRDEGGFKGTLQILPESAPFSISPDGTITVRDSTALDREVTDKIMFQVEARETNPPHYVSKANVSVTLLDENDNSPKFNSDKYEKKVTSQTVGMMLVKVEAEDPDAGVNGQVKYSIEFGNQEDHFSINDTTGEITLKTIIPLEEHQTLEFLLFITARDGGEAPRSASAQVKIVAVGDTSAQFTQSTYSGTIEEETAAGTVILKVDFIAVEGSPVTLGVETESDKFNISSSGEFTNLVPLDYDEAPHSYSVNISISDGVNTDTAVVEVQVTDVNDNSPVFDSSSVNKSVSEDAKEGLSVAVVAATDKDSSFNKEIRYWLIGGEGKFAINASSGMVSVAAALDRETKAEYDLQVVAEDQGRPAKSSTASLLVQVTDINDNAPKFSQAVYQVEVSETESVGADLFTLSAVDPDEGANGRVTYSIVQQSPPSDPPAFELVSSNGTLRLAKLLDWSEVKEYSLKVQASDGGTPSLVGSSSVVLRLRDVNNNPPEFSEDRYNVSVSENLARDSPILTLEVTDRDEGGFKGTLQILPESAPFSISPDGTITVRDSTALDREVTDKIMFQVEARETNPPHHVATANVSVTLLDENDNSPKFNSYKYEKKVTSQTVGMMLVKVEAEDPDAGVNGQVKYSIEFGNQEDHFSINDTTGEITLKTIIPLEEHQTLEFSLTITARDGGEAPRSASAQVKIVAVGDTSAQFTQSTYSGTIEEETAAGTVILKVDFIAVEGSPVTLGVETESDKFNISSSGEFTNLVPLDYDEAPHSYSVNISISDGVNTDTAVVEVQVTDVNDNSPVFDSSSVNKSVSEDAKEGLSVAVVAATDKDSSFNKEIRYWLIGGEGKFAINASSGMVSVAAALDRETKAEYDLQVVAEDQGRPAKSSTASLLVQVTDINDNAPKFSQAVYQVEVSETESVGADLFTLSAVDPDEGANGRVTYSIVQQSPPSDPPAFELVSSNGTLRLAKLLDWSEVKEYSLKVQASDGGTPSLVGSSSVVLRLRDVNNNPPEFSEDRYNVSVSENLARDSPILTLEVTDRDEGGFKGTLQILPESAPFSISPDGTITVRDSTALDREVTDKIMFQVEARETNPPHYVSKANVSVTLLDENDNSPKFNSDKYEKKVTSQTVGMMLVKVEAEDPDAGVNGQVKYSIEFGNQEDHFSINDTTGEITLKTIIPLEEHQTLEFSLTITARDGGEAPRSASAQVKIVAVGDTSAQFTQSTYSGTIEEETAAGTVILKVDFIAVEGSPVTLGVETESDKFNISSSGEFTNLVPLDYDEAPHSYSVNISISDGVNTDTAVVEVQVTDVNDNSPVFDSSSVNKSVSEDAKEGLSVAVVAATDKDSSFNKEIRYWLIGGEGKFAINASSGMVSVAAALDRETKAEYDLQVVAEDQGRPAKSSTASLLVQVTDINDNAPKFSQAVYQVEVSETESVGADLFTLSAVDPDEGANGRVTYSIVQQSPPSDPPAFELVSSSGTLRLAKLLDWSEVKEYSLKVQASDGGTPSLVGSSSVVLRLRDVNNNPPEFSEDRYNVSVSENLARDSPILTLEVTDRDEGGFKGTLQILPESAPFSISPDGTITVRDSTALDREVTDKIMFQVEARETNPPHHVATANVSVTLLDENDNSPKFNSDKYEKKVTSQTVGMMLVKVEAEDPDAGVNGQVKYSIEFGNQEDHFSINDTTGEITLKTIIPQEEHQTLEFLLFITARDGGEAPRSASAQVKIVAVGDTSAQFTQSTYSGTIEEETAAGTVILKVDFIAVEGSPVTLGVETESDKFNISSSGEFTNLVPLDYDEAPHSYSVNISISDGVNTDTAVVEVQVTDVNDNSPVFDSSSVNKSVSEDAKEGLSVAVVAATDKDSSFNKEIRYWLIGGEGKFAINASSGMVSVAAALDRETKAEYDLQVVAEDQGRPAKSSTASLLVQVTDINDNAPKFSQAVYQVEVSETESVGADLFTLSAVDPDEGANGRVTYSIVQQSPPSDPPAFELVSSNGTLRLAKLLDWSEVKEYSLKVQASDGGTPSLVGSSSVVLRLRDVNNNPPEFSEDRYNVSVPENLARDSPILTLEVTDRDEGGFKGTLQILPESAPFSISPDGTITVRDSTALDREVTDKIMFQVEARETNPPHYVSKANVSVTLLDENDNSPKFNSDKYEKKVTSQTVGMMLVKVEAEDPDAGVNGQVKYSIEFGNQEDHFSINDTTGEITLKTIIPLEEHQTLEFSLTITARDGGEAPRSASAQVKIVAVGDTSAQFTQSTYSGTIEEETAAGTVILKVDFIAVEGSPVTLGVETESDKFNISSSGEFTNLVPLDYDEAPHSYSVNISISDGVNTDTAVVEVQVTDVNDNSPVFDSSSVNKSVSEDAKEGLSVAVVAATDKDSSFNKEIRYWLIGGEGKFAINASSGMVSVAAALDRETKAEYDLQVVAEDQGRPAKSSTASLLVQVTDINDNAPKFSQAVYQVEVSETESVGADLFTLSAVDPDEGANGRVTYSIVQQSPPSDPPAFELVSSNGTLRLAKLLDWSEVKEYSLKVQASDGGTPSLVGSSSVVLRLRDVNNNPPEFSEDRYNVSVSENLARDSPILTLEVTDRDEGGFKGTLQILPESAPFSISPDGTITVRDSTALDREVTDKIMFQVEARETNPPHHVATANVSVTLLDENDNSPKFNSDKYEKKVTSQTVGMMLVKVEAEDPDAGVNGQVKYSIEFGNQEDHFSINDTTGEITLKTIIPLEEHQTLEFSLTITARDGGEAPRSASAQVKIVAVGDTSAQFTQSTYSGTIEEETAAGTVILKVDFIAVEGSPVTLGVETESDKFNISSSGEFTNLVPLDYDEAPHSYSVNISISDGVNTDTAVVEVQVTDVNDNSPVFDSSSVNKSVSEDAKEGLSVAVVAATDKDSSFNKEIRYWLIGGEGKFAINASSGMVSVAAALDRETKAEYDLQVVAEDQGRPAKSSTASLLVQVTDINDNAPKFSQAVYQVEVSETESVGADLFTLSAVDPDEGANGRVTYSIVQQSPPSDPPAFELVSSNGTLRLAKLLDWSEVKEYSLKVQASDGGTPSLVGSSSVVLRLRDVNNNPPEFSEDRYNVSVSENLARDSPILTLEVTDRDEGGFKGTLQILPESAPFSISPDGTITVRDSTALDREVTDKIMFQVEARETNPPHHVATANVSVTLLDENDNSPKFNSDKYEKKVTSQTVGMMLVKVEAEDPDAGVNGQVKYSIEFGNQEDHFSINDTTGEITLKTIIPLEEHQTLEFLLFITARDGGEAPRSASAQVKIVAVGDTSAQFTQSTYSGTIEEETAAGTVILKVDFIAVEGSPVTLGVETESDKFNISSSGEFTNLVPLDYDEAPHSYSVNISISDGVNTDTAVVEVQVTDVNDNSPVFDSSSVNKSVSEDAKEGLSVAVVAATDKDSSFNKEIRYWLIGGEGKFAINASSGMVSVAAALDRETKAEYDLQVVAEDQGRPAKSSTASLLVQVTDINDNAPKFSQAVYQVEVSETESVGADLFTLSAVDPDEGANGRVTYSIVQQSPPSDPPAFELVSSNGTLRLAKLLDWSEVKEYSLKVQASDGGTPSLVGSSSVVLRLRDVNNNPPEFSEDRYNVSVPENLARDSPILTLEVTDRDEGGFKGTLQILPESAPFSISPDGTITVRDSTALDREVTDKIMFQVEARETNPPHYVSKANVSVTLLDENDNSPKFNSDKYEKKVTSQTVGMMLVKVEAEDLDAGVNGQVKYSIEFGNQEDHFSINDTTGEITLKTIIPLEEHQTLEFSLTITARDGGEAPRSASAQVKIVAVGDTSAQFTQSTYSGTIEEETAAGTVILKVDFIAVEGSPVTLGVETESDKFNISSSGEFTNLVPLDYDEAPHSYSVNISISDGVNTDTAVVEVQVTDVNDNSPVFDSSSVNKSVSEDAKEGLSVAVVAATDKDSSFNKEIRYWLIGGEGKFAINASSGMVSVAAALDRETKAEYDLQVVAEDQGRPAKSSTASLLVQVTDINDNAPKFSQAVYQVEVSETESVGADLFTLSAVDPDEGANGRVTYSIVQQSPPSDPPAFELVSSNGTLRLAKLLDWSEVKEYSLKVQASDGGTPSLVGSSSVVLRLRDVNNNPPEFSEESYNVSVPENLPSGVNILTLEVTDRDEGGFKGTLQILPESAPFSISPDGTITVRDSTALDREVTDKIMFQVEARETNPPHHVATANVSVTLLDENDNSPKFNSDKYEKKVTSQTVGMMLVKVEAEDPDAGVNGQVKYSIEFGNQEDHFSINDTTGEITLKTIIPLEEHQTLEFSLTITARDGGEAPRSASAQVKIFAVGDTSAQFTQSTYSGTIEEETAAGTVILKVDFIAVEGSPVTLGVETESDKFNISSSGEFTNLVPLDYDEAPHSYSVNISISDGVNTDTAVVEVQVTDVNDNSPVFDSSSVNKSVSEDAKEGLSVAVVAATDKDSSFNKEIRYWLIGGEGKFAINASSGMVSVAAALDRETKAEYDLQVVAEDQGRPAKSSTASLLVQVTDINDNAPKFSQAVYQVEVSETESVGADLFTLSAVDPDEGANGRVTYSIVQQSPPSDPPAFELVSSNGTLRLAKLLDWSEVKEYSLKVQASDGGTPSLVGSSSVVLRLRDVNNNPPEFSEDRYNVSVPENLARDSPILTLEVTDRDEGGFSRGYFLYTSDTFDISNRGVVTLKNNVTLDRETKDSYVLQVVAVDQPSDGLSATAQLSITVLDYNDNAPQFPAIPNPIQFPEGDYSKTNPGEVFRIVPTDPDLGANGEVTVSLVSPHPLFTFREDGMLLAVGSLDRESEDTYDLVVKALDNGSPQRERVTSIRVSLTDVNDNTPEFSSSSYFNTVPLADAAEGKLVLTLMATDLDIGKNSRITYSFSAGSSPYLALNSETGEVTLTSDAAEVTEETTLELTAMATDNGQPPRSSTGDGTWQRADRSPRTEAHVMIKLVTLRVFSMVDSIAFSSSKYNFIISENAPVGEIAGMVFASSGSSLYNVTYTLKAHTDLFSISDFGAIQTRKQLDKEKQEWYTLIVEAVDTRTPPTSAVAMVTVQVEDVNESPQFPSEVYRASVFSIAPYKTPVVHVKASDPDVADEGQLVYSLTAGRPHFDVEPSSGLVYVVSAVDLAGQQAAVEVKATDPRGLQATTKVEVTVEGSVSRDDVVVLSLNQPAHSVDRNVPALEKALGAALNWTVNVIEVSVAHGGASESRTLRAPVKTLVSFIALEGEGVGAVSSEEVTKKLKTESDYVTAELVTVFGEGLQFEMEMEPQRPAPNQSVIIGLSAGLALSILGLIVAVFLTWRVKRTVRGDNSLDKQRHVEGYTNWSQDILETELGPTKSQQPTNGQKVPV